MVDDFGSEAFFFCCLVFFSVGCACRGSSAGASEVFCLLTGGSDEIEAGSSFGLPFVSGDSWCSC